MQKFLISGLLLSLVLFMKDGACVQEKLLEKIVSTVREDDRISGLWVVGSMATGNVDRYSDLDAYLLVDEENYDQIFSERSFFAEKIGDVLCSFEVEWPNCQLYGVILENFIEVDLCYCKPEQIEIFGPHKILVDKKGNLDELLSKHIVEFKTDIKKKLTEHLDFAAYNLLHAINMLGRGEYWSSIRQIETLRKRIISLVGLRTNTDVEEEYRRLELLIEKETNEALQETLCSYEFESIAKAIQNAAFLFMHEARKTCNRQHFSFPSKRFERLIEYLDEIVAGKAEKSL